MKLNYSIDDLRLFWVVAQQGSFTKAAYKLAMPVSTLSRRINHLEQVLALRLLNRDAHRVILTGTGQQYFDRCDALFNEFQYISSELMDEKHEANGKIRISAPINMTQQWLGMALNQFMDRYPNIKIELTLSNTNIDIVDQSIDIAFRAGEPNITDWIARPLYQIQFILCASHYQPQWHNVNHPSELADQPIILAKPMSEWELVELETNERFNYMPMSNNIKFSVDDIKIASHAVETGLGIGFLPHFIVSPLIEKGAIKQIMSNWSGVKRNVYIVYRDRSNQPHRLRLLIDYILNSDYQK